MTDARKGVSSSPAPATPANKKGGASAAAKIKDEEGTIKVASKKNEKDVKDGASASKSSGVIKLKKPPPKHKQPGNWKDGTYVDQEKKKGGKNTTIPPPSPSPVANQLVNQLDETARETFATGRPLEDAVNLQMCKHCKKSVLSTAAKQHIAACLKLKKEKAQRKKEAKEARERAREQAAREEEEEKRKAEGGGDKDDESSDSDDNDKKATGTPNGKGKKAAVGGKKAEAAGAGADSKAGAGGAGGATANKKRKADAEIEKAAPKKKKKEETKPKTAKPKGPVDVERQCGVILPNGQACARSLTCKSHSMGAKRAVPGRSLPYDMLLAAYQKKNQAKQQKAAIDASAPVEDEEEANGGAVDEGEEAAAVMNALASWRPRPVVPQPSYMPIRRQYELARLYEQLNMATNGGRVNIFAVSGFGMQTLPEGHPGLEDSEDAMGEPDNDAMMMMPPAVPASASGSTPTITAAGTAPRATSTTPIPIPAAPSLSSPPVPVGR
ncbi:saga complex component [Ophiostoma piceae UAMH 11346]|uniref:Saga complex component n=1 Tax=Ophiostoma piceae (strain UAMH 11346) TaxID=1262450 RepID=S3D7Q3_OPHP1|nr:saga complex component [Ophiostoma piceae UAMH 11346]